MVRYEETRFGKVHGLERLRGPIDYVLYTSRPHHYRLGHTNQLLWRAGKVIVTSN